MAMSALTSPNTRCSGSNGRNGDKITETEGTGDDETKVVEEPIGGMGRWNRNPW